MLVEPNMIKEYICLPLSLVIAQILQTLALGGSRMAPHLLVMNQAKQHKYIQANNRNRLKQYTNHWKTEAEGLKTSSTYYNNKKVLRMLKTDLKQTYNAKYMLTTALQGLIHEKTTKKGWTEGNRGLKQSLYKNQRAEMQKH